MGILLAIIARVGLWTLTPLFIIINLICFWLKNPPKKAWELTNNYFENMAVGADIIGNVVGGKNVWNFLFKKGSNPNHDFGGFHTISCDLGLNHQINDQTIFARMVSIALEKIDPNHLQKAIHNMRKYLAMMATMLLGVTASHAQSTFPVDDYVYKIPFEEADTVTQMRLTVDDLQIDLTTHNQKPVFLLQFQNKDGKKLFDRYIYYTDMQKACQKDANETQESCQTKINQAYVAVIVGTAQQKMFVVNEFVSKYGIYLKGFKP
ncbi:hypothetical protein P1X15_10745 [Runella sp. MFBS21]|uniref:hypothetical protein n=1 Tax=Runella sp. MFBS21 TaxID=3034018 RepID=UPI0023F74E53|nr:hypothetical protein [Runella sp. MFBS21]MDF7818077.1 hypothetical protein [Runella sp. MFBS21]